MLVLMKPTLQAKLLKLYPYSVLYYYYFLLIPSSKHNFEFQQPLRCQCAISRFAIFDFTALTIT